MSVNQKRYLAEMSTDNLSYPLFHVTEHSAGQVQARSDWLEIFKNYYYFLNFFFPNAAVPPPTGSTLGDTYIVHAKNGAERSYCQHNLVKDLCGVKFFIEI